MSACLDHQALERFLIWIRPLQQALSLEAERGFSDLEGRKERFHCFMQRELATPPEIPLPGDVSPRLQSFADGFADYASLGDAARRRQVTVVRQWLHALRQRLEPSAPMAPPRLKVAQRSASATASSSSLPALELSLIHI